MYTIRLILIQYATFPGISFYLTNVDADGNTYGVFNESSFTK